MDCPVGHGGAAYIYSDTREYLLLTVKGKSVGKFGDKYVGNEACGSDTLRNKLWGKRGYTYSSPFALYAFTTLAGVFVADMPYNLDLGGYDVELLRYIFTYAAHNTSALTALLLFAQVMNYLYTG